MITLGTLDSYPDVVISKSDLLQILQTLDKRQLMGLFLSEQEKDNCRFLSKRSIIHYISHSRLKPVVICSGASKCVTAYNRLQGRG